MGRLPGHVQPAIPPCEVSHPYGRHAQGVLAGADRARRCRGSGLHVSHLRARLATADDDDGDGGGRTQGHDAGTASTPGSHQDIIDGVHLSIELAELDWVDRVRTLEQGRAAVEQVAAD